MKHIRRGVDLDVRRYVVVSCEATDRWWCYSRLPTRHCWPASQSFLQDCAEKRNVIYWLEVRKLAVFIEGILQRWRELK